MVSICDLNPHPTDWKLWYDEHGNQLKLNDTRITINLTKTPNNTTRNIFIKALPKSIANNSYWLMLMEGANEKVFCFMGNDGLLRICYFVDEEWKGNLQPLYIGLEPLQKVINEYLNLEMEKISVKSSLFKVKKAWYGGWPGEKWKGKTDCLI